MAIRKSAKNMFIRVNNKYYSRSGTLIKHAQRINIESIREDLALISNMKITTMGENK